ncbi:hypothetical protein CTAM01_08075 [Colletotrichum tamarilloi]|uniref:Uncharacterized protein n=1 Tax=Colletotrichum tamarilloi TaxID=1209934 RepID=A0ABQ9R764_9PEZI|nr:uncharacterized protein CTAM01_08075 [Colletotrichum tamarilloi]KAI3544648.1 hypothetical protein CSPX01_05447 [Colletotrichum filicis]KAK1497063.1 hypothetical protein CTAM01_08075 [Colletotrichum tamarilloi]
MASFFSKARLATFSKFAAGATITGAAGFHLWTRQCAFDDTFTPANDPLFQHSLLKKVNPNNNPDFHDCCYRTVSFDKLRPDLVEDALSGGSKLVETYSAGVWGRYAFNIQRKIMEMARKDKSNAGDLWEKEELLKSTYPIGTAFADDFIVIEKSPSSILLRGGLSPRVAPDGPRELDSIITLDADLDRQARVVSFKLKSILLNGVSDGNGAPLPGPAVFLHQQYAKLLVTAGVDHCVA